MDLPLCYCFLHEQNKDFTYKVLSDDKRNISITTCYKGKLVLIVKKKYINIYYICMCAWYMYLHMCIHVYVHAHAHTDMCIHVYVHAYIMYIL